MLRWAKFAASVSLFLAITSTIGATISGNSPWLSVGLLLIMTGTLLMLNVKET
jgi:hypothetical protein